MEDVIRWSGITAVAPITWGTTYYVTSHALPAGHPLWGAVLRAVPAGLVLLAVRRRRPHGSWWWRAAVLGTLNTGVFFALVYLAAQLLPTSVAATVMATSPVTMLLLAWPLLGRRPAAAPLLGAASGLVGVALLVGAGGAAADVRGVVASVAALLMSSLGYVLAARWSRAAGDPAPDVLASTSWQLLAGGLALVPAALAAEGAPPALDDTAVAGFAFVALVATALAFSCWFAGLAHLEPGTVGLLGLLNPLTGVALGTALAGERLTGWQAFGVVLVLTGVLAGQPIAHHLRPSRPNTQGVTAHLTARASRTPCPASARPPEARPRRERKNGALLTSEVPRFFVLSERVRPGTAWRAPCPARSPAASPLPRRTAS